MDRASPSIPTGSAAGATGAGVAAAAVGAPRRTAQAWFSGATIVALLWLAVAALFYQNLIYPGHGNFFPSVQRGLTFNSMLSHLIEGRFDVDPRAIGPEGFLRNGAVYPYFGILPALLRLPFLPLPHFATTDFTVPSCLFAACLMALFKLMSLLAVWRKSGNRQGSGLVAPFGVAILFSGAQVQFLRPSLYEEPSLWADVFAAAFVYLVLRGIYSGRGFTGGLLSWLALAAGLCLLTRVSTALGLWVAFGLIWLHLAWRRVRERLQGWIPLLAPLPLLFCFAAVAGIVNYERSGNPLVFMDLHNYLFLLGSPERMLRLREYGEFNPLRLGYGLMYYFLPIWILPGGDGQLLWAQFQQRMIDSVELPPSSFLISDPLLVGLTLYTLVCLIRGRDIPGKTVVVAVATGLLVPIVLMLAYIGMAFRFRIEFYPFLEFCALIGVGRLLAEWDMPRKGPLVAAALTGVVVSLGLYCLYRKSPLGSADNYLAGPDILSLYRTLLLR